MIKIKFDAWNERENIIRFLSTKYFLNLRKIPGIFDNNSKFIKNMIKWEALCYLICMSLHMFRKRFRIDLL